MFFRITSSGAWGCQLEGSFLEEELKLDKQWNDVRNKQSVAINTKDSLTKAINHY